MSATVKVVSLPARDSLTATDVTVAAPATGSGWVARSAIQFADKQGPAIAVLFDDSSASVKHTANENLTPTADATVTKRFFFTSAATLTKLAFWALTAPASTSGTVLITAKKNAGNTVLSAANYNAESLVDATYTAMTLTNTAADLAFAAGDYLELKIVSNNADMTGAADLRAALEFAMS